METIGKKIASLRKSKSYTQEKLAGIIGVSAQAVSKWENETTMPDIMLLPVIADIFEISIDELFGKDSPKESRKITFEDVTDVAYDAVLESMARAWANDGSGKSVEEVAETTKKQLQKHPQSHSMILSYKNGGVYANSKLGLVFNERFEKANVLLEDENATELLKVLSDPMVCKVLLYLLKHSNAAVTAASVAAKCGLAEEEAGEALTRLWNHNFTTCQSVDMGNEPLKVYHVFGGHKMLLVYAILSLSKTLSEYQESYHGLRA